MTLEEILNSVSEAEWSARRERGLPVQHLLDMAEFPFAFTSKNLQRFAAAVSQWAAQTPDDPGPQSINAWMKVTLGDYAGADQILRRYQQLLPSDPHGQMRFAEPPQGQRMQLPSVGGDWPAGPSFFVACDPIYLRLYGMPLLRSLASQSPGAPLHVHVMGQERPSFGDCNLRVSVTWEDPSEILGAGVDAKSYFHAVRLIRFAEALRRSDAPLIMCDADALVMSDPTHLLSTSDEVGLRVRPGRIEPWNYFSACLVRGTPSALPYFDEVSDIIKTSLKTPFWGLDQYALFAAYLHHRPPITLFGPDVAAVSADTPGTFWFTAGKAKDDLFKSETKYAQAYRRYAV